MNNITDRTCFNLKGRFTVEYRFDKINMSTKQIETKIKKMVEPQLRENFSNFERVPLMLINSMTQDIDRIVEYEDTETTSVIVDCEVDMTFEEVDNTPTRLAYEILKMLFGQFKNTRIFDFNVIDNPPKGYIQSDNSIYFP